MNVSERLAQEQSILREIRMTLSTFRSVSPGGGTRRKGAVYASSPVTSGLRLFQLMRETGLRSPQDFKAAHPDRYKAEIMAKNISSGEQFGKTLQGYGYPLVIVPGQFFASGWAQEHYMSLWRQVIIRYARTLALNNDWQWSTGCIEEFLIALQNNKKIILKNGQLIRSVSETAGLVKQAVYQVDDWGFDSKPIYDLWRQIELTLDAIKEGK